MAKIEAGYNVLLRVCDALGLNKRRVRRIVLDVAVDDVAKLYIEELPDTDACSSVAKVLANTPAADVEVTSVTSNGCEEGIVVNPVGDAGVAVEVRDDDSQS